MEKKTTDGEEENRSTTCMGNKLFTMVMARKDKGIGNSY
jgi:hypothetical protein